MVDLETVANSVRLAVNSLGCGGMASIGMLGAIGLGYLGIKKADNDMKRGMFKEQYARAMDELGSSSAPAEFKGVGELIRLRYDHLKGIWTDEAGKPYDAKCVNIVPMDVYYGFGEFTRSDVLVSITANAEAVSANAYSIGEQTLYVHRDTVLAVAFFKAMPIKQKEKMH